MIDIQRLRLLSFYDLRWNRNAPRAVIDVLGPLLDAYEAACAVALHRKAAWIDCEAWDRERVRLAEALDEALERIGPAEGGTR